MNVRVPASIANLGPGFDVLAMAVDIWLEVEAEPAAAPDWRFEGEGASWLESTDHPFARIAMRGRVRNSIPVGVGLGSSAAARLAAQAISGRDLEGCIDAAVAQEGHPDNVVAAARGGIRLVYGAGRDMKLPDRDWAIALAVAREPVPTERAREVLPREVPLADAAFNAGRAALFVAAVWAGEPEQLRPALEDRLHQPYRRELYPWTADVIDAALEGGAYGSAIAGAGPSVFAFCRGDEAAAVAEAMAEASGGNARPLVTRISPEGMSIAP